jgi:WD40 repeat protein
VNDSQRLLLEHFDTIRNSPSQIYHLALPFSPSSSWLHKYYTAELLGMVKVVRGLPAEWGMCSRTVELDYSPLALDHWKENIAVGSQSNDILLLSAITGSQVALLSGHANVVRSLTFSLDGSLLVSGSLDWTLKLWDVQTGGVIKTFHGHTGPVSYVSISPDCTMVASGSYDESIHVWDVLTGECHYTIKEQGDVYCIIFSPVDPQHLISICSGVVQEWDINGQCVVQEWDINSSHAKFSSNGTHFISCWEGVAAVQNTNSRAVVVACVAPNNKPYLPHLTHCCFSPNNRLVAAAAGNTVHIWDITGSDSLPIKTLIGHIDTITSLIFTSPSTLISASADNSVKFWKIGISTSLTAGDSESTPPTSASIQSINLQVENGIVISSDGNGVVRMWDISTGLCKGSVQTPATSPYTRDAQVIDGKLIFVWLGESRIFTWGFGKVFPSK